LKYRRKWKNLHTVTPLLNGTWVQREPVWSGNILQPQGSELAVPLLKETFVERKKFRFLAVPS